MFVIINPRLHRRSGGNLVFFLSVYEQNFWRTNNIGISIEILKDTKLCKDQNKRQAFSKTFWL